MGDEPNSLVLFGISLGVLTLFVLFLWAINAIKARLIMSRAAPETIAPAGGLNQSVDQSVPTSLEKQTSTPSKVVLADMDAENDDSVWELPRVSRYLSDEEFITFLAAQKLRDGKYRLSANKIVAAAGGDRTEVLAIIRQVREQPAPFPERTPEQQAARAELGLQ